MKKQKVSLELFEEAVLPMLQQKHADIAALQAAIKAGYEIYEEDDGKQVAINYKVTGKNKPAADADDDDADTGHATTTLKGFDEKAMAALIAKSIEPLLKPIETMQKRLVDIGEGEMKITSRAVPENLKVHKPIQAFSGTGEEKKYKAFRFGQWFLGGVMGNPKAAQWCEDNGVKIAAAPKSDDSPTIIIGKSQNEGVNTAGGILVPDVLENDIIDLRELYGVFRANARIRPMVRDTLTVPRRLSGVTAYFTAEEGSITDSSKAWNSAQLIAKKLAALVKYSTEVLEDAIISIADDLAQEIVYAFSLKEDQCGFVGDGTSTYGGIFGVTNAITNVWTSTSATAAGSVIAAGNTMAEVTDADLMQVMGSLPEYADDGTAGWYSSRLAAFSIFARLLRASGGTTPAQAAGALPVAYAGYPIKITQVMPRTDANSQVLAVFGSLKKAASFGDRRQTTIMISDQRYFENDQVGIRGTERFDINVHDVGDGTDAGPVVALRASAS